MASQNNAWTTKERGEEATYIPETEVLDMPSTIDHAQQEGTKSTPPSAENDFEGGFGGQEDLEDRYATTSGEH